MLASLGFGPFFQRSFAALGGEELFPARVAFASREIFHIIGMAGELVARPVGRLRREELPVTGDWVAARLTQPGEAVVESVLPRAGVLARKEPGRGSARQVLAANVDLALLVQAAPRPSARSLERYAALAWDGGARPVVVLTKRDLVADPAAALALAAEAVPGAPVIALSAATGAGLDALAPLLPFGATAALLGPSGAGKSTLANALAGRALLATRDVRTGDGKGRHTTTARQLVPLPCGAWLLDTPGLREVGLALADAPEGFAEIDALARACRFRDCRHESEPGCAVLAAAGSGALDPERLASRRKLEREARWAAAREESTAAAVEKRRWKVLMKGARHTPSGKRRFP